MRVFHGGLVYISKASDIVVVIVVIVVVIVADDYYKFRALMEGYRVI